jgi:cysteine synthase A
MEIRDGFIGAIGRTPLIRLDRLSQETGCEILGKAEFLNPGGSVKDRAALYIVRDAEQRGVLRHGGVIVEGTAGNTGIGLALVGNALGYRTVIVMPETQSQEKKDALPCGADLRLVPAVAGRIQATTRPERLAAELARRSRTARSGRTSSTTSPTAAPTTRPPARRLGADGWRRRLSLRRHRRYARRRRSGPRRRGSQRGASFHRSARAAIFNYYAHGELRAEGDSITEGIGQGRITKNLEGAPIDDWFQIPDEEALPVIFDLLRYDGLCVGGSTGINVAGAIRIARKLGPGHTIVTVLADSGQRYQSKLFNPEFLRAKGLPVPPWL